MDHPVPFPPRHPEFVLPSVAIGRKGFRHFFPNLWKLGFLSAPEKIHGIGSCAGYPPVLDPGMTRTGIELWCRTPEMVLP
jgi:hypothetical protein